MKKFQQLVITKLLTLLLSLSAVSLLASTASPYPFDFDQPDGTTVTIRLRGDERIKWAETMDQYSLLRNNAGAWEYAVLNESGDMVPSGLLAHNADERSADELALLAETEKLIFYSKEQVNLIKSLWEIRHPKGATDYTPTGTKNLVMILMNFADLAFTKTQADFDNLMNQINYAGMGSFRDYHLENSYGNFEINTTVVGPYTASQNMKYYGENDDNGWDKRPEVLVAEAISASDSQIDYADYDLDNDGTVDAGVYVVYAGYGEESGYESYLIPNAIWAHAGSLSGITVDGKTVDRYACSSELRDITGSMIRDIGVKCHEFGHTMGAPDYYDTDYSDNGQYDGTGYWDIMGAGNWNDNGDRPAHHNPFTKTVTYGWATAALLSTAQNVALGDITAYPDIVKYTTTTSGEYFLCENRQQTGFNAALPGYGLMIWHVDETYINNNFSSNSINTGAHQGLYPKSGAATTDNGVHTSTFTYSEINDPDCPWPSGSGFSQKNVFDDSSTPWSKSWAGNTTGKPLSNIKRNGELATFCFMSCDSNDPSNFAGSGFSSSQIDLHWPSSPYPVILAYNTEPVFGTPVNGSAYSAGDDISGGGEVIYNGSTQPHSHTSLSANTTYYYKAWSVMAGDNYSRGVTTSATTQCGIDDTPYSEYFGYTFIPDCWSQVDHASSGSLWEFGKADFNSVFPALAGNYAYLNSEDYGSGNSQNVDLISPAIDLSNFAGVNIQFKHYYSKKSSSTATLSFSTDGTNWTTIQSWSTTTTNPATYNQNISGPAGNAQVYFKWNFTGSFEYGWAIDDVTITGIDHTWNGSGGTNWHTSTNWLNGKIPQSNSDVIIPNNLANYPVISTAPPTVNCNNLTIASAASLTIGPGAELSINGTLTNNNGNNGLVIKSLMTGTGSLLHQTANVPATVERFIDAWNDGSDGWHLLSSPVAMQLINSAFTVNQASDYDFYAWDESTNYWVNFKNQSSGGGTSPYFDVVNGSLSFNVGDGYLVGYQNQSTKYFTGNLNHDDVVITGLGISGGNNKGWHLLGNPFPSAIIWDNSWSKTNIGKVLNIWNEAGKSYSALNADDGNPIPMANGFMVQVNSSPGSITIPANSRVHHAQAWYKKSTYPVLYLLARNLDNPSFQESQVRFNPAATLGFDPDHDGRFLPGYAPQFYSVMEGENLIVNSLPDATKATVIPFSFIKNQGTNFTIELEESEDAGLGLSVFLLDKLRDVRHNLSENNIYQFTSETGDTQERFELYFGHVGISEEPMPLGASVYYYDGKLYLTAKTETLQLDVISIHGQVLQRHRLTGSGSHTVDIHLPAGVYIARISNSETFKTVKMIINK
jgi:M6 family metalloprotease-like protein